LPINDEEMDVLDRELERLVDRELLLLARISTLENIIQEYRAEYKYVLGQERRNLQEQMRDLVNLRAMQKEVS